MFEWKAEATPSARTRRVSFEMQGCRRILVRDATEAEGWDVLRKGKPCRAGDQAWLWGSPGRGIAAGKPRGPHVVVPTAAA
ncbi:hypothetical protein DIPPA_27865 [Diplonema papillatum]|nr:hypothetical protein DIPPA_27865 [Diplonema papillatum]